VYVYGVRFIYTQYSRGDCLPVLRLHQVVHSVLWYTVPPAVNICYIRTSMLISVHYAMEMAVLLMSRYLMFSLSNSRPV